MSLSSFITSQREQILEAWEENAISRQPQLAGANVRPLRDHLGELLEAIAQDLDIASKATPEPGEQAHADKTWAHVEAVGAKHGAGRAHQGVTLQQMVPEFPALRTCVMRLWRQELRSPTIADVDDLLRFDEAMDLALTQSVSEFMDRLSRSRERFLSILGHDLRDPLSTILAAARLMRDEELDRSKLRDVAGRIITTTERMHQLVVDLLDFTRTRVGQMPIEPRDVDLGDLVRNVAGEFKTAHPRRDVHVNVSGDLRGRWDDKRMGQAVGNLMANALQHGAKDKPIAISTSVDDSEVTIAVHNEGPPIPEDRRNQLFDPLGAPTSREHGKGESSRLGLGLYITKAIVAGHGGSIEVESSPEQGTTFTCHLPKGGAIEASDE